MVVVIVVSVFVVVVVVVGGRFFLDHRLRGWLPPIGVHFPPRGKTRQASEKKIFSWVNDRRLIAGYPFEAEELTATRSLSLSLSLSIYLSLSISLCLH